VISDRHRGGGLRVTGLAVGDYPPDQVTLTGHLSGTESLGPQALEQIERAQRDLVAQLVAVGLETTDLVWGEFELGSTGSTGSLKSKPAIPTAIHAWRVTTGRLSLVPTVVERIRALPLVQLNRIRYGLSFAELRSVVRELQAAALADGRAQAEELAAAAGVRIGELRQLQVLPSPMPDGSNRAEDYTLSAGSVLGSYQGVVARQSTETTLPVTLSVAVQLAYQILTSPAEAVTD
jgi:uncharacterized protein YggE